LKMCFKPRAILLEFSKSTVLSTKMLKSRLMGYSAKGTKGKWRYANSKARLKCATYRG